MPTTSTSRGVCAGLGAGTSGTMASTIAATRANLDIVTPSIVKVNGGAARFLIARACRRCNAGPPRLPEIVWSARPTGVQADVGFQSHLQRANGVAAG